MEFKKVNISELKDHSKAGKYLLGCLLVRQVGDRQIVAKIVETESYHQLDPASHSFGGKTERNKAMFSNAGIFYVYFSYGMHWCLNIVTGKEDIGSGVLIRAIEPIEGLDLIKQNRVGIAGFNITNGPGKLTKALQIDKSLYGHDITKPPLQIFEPENRNFEISTSTRIGISKAKDEMLRFYIKDNQYVSKS